ncbi:hypothetical protein C8Q80DRAFT_1210780 [Daedaleopsis nitida]|nr:hypothetical protein C8Q80DRAFT_1210780 [Daedaleopsis nitida]
MVSSTLIHHNDTRIQYSPSSAWNPAASGFKVPRLPDAEATLVFEGTDVTVLRFLYHADQYQAPHCMKCVVDETTLSLNNLQLPPTSTEHFRMAMCSTSGLSPTAHTMKIFCADGHVEQNFFLDQIIVASRPVAVTSMSSTYPTTAFTSLPTSVQSSSSRMPRPTPIPLPDSPQAQTFHIPPPSSATKPNTTVYDQPTPSPHLEGGGDPNSPPPPSTQKEDEPPRASASASIGSNHQGPIIGGVFGGVREHLQHPPIPRTRREIRHHCWCTCARDLESGEVRDDSVPSAHNLRVRPASHHDRFVLRIQCRLCLSGRRVTCVRRTTRASLHGFVQSTPQFEWKRSAQRER